MTTKIQLRRGTASQWSAADPTLYEGEVGIELDTYKMKVGNGSSTWTQLSYMNVVPSDFNTTIGDYLQIADLGTASGPAQLDGNLNILVPGDSIIIEGSAADSYQLILQSINPTADRTVLFQDKSGTAALTSDISDSIKNIGLKTNNTEATITGIESETSIDSALDSEWRTLKYLIQMTHSGEIHSSEVIIANDGSNLLISQYGDVFSNAELATITANKTSGIINLKVTPISGKTPLTVRFFRTGIVA